MRTIAILQARMGSTRLPGKVLEELGDRTVLEQCLQRARSIGGIGGVCLATTEHARDDRIVETAGAVPGVAVYRGSETDVLQRYARAAEMMQADVVLRITCDCPLIDPDVCQQLLELRGRENASYAANNFEREWPHGLDCEAFTRRALDEADRNAVESYDREHVGPYMRRLTLAKPVHLKGPGGQAARQRWTVDYPEDLDFMRALWPHLPQGRIASWRDVMSAVERHPEIATINARHVA